MATLNLLVVTSCGANGGVLTIKGSRAAGDGIHLYVEVLNEDGDTLWFENTADVSLETEVDNLPDGVYTVLLSTSSDDTSKQATISCGSTGGGTACDLRAVISEYELTAQGQLQALATWTTSAGTGRIKYATSAAGLDSASLSSAGVTLLRLNVAAGQSYTYYFRDENDCQVSVSFTAPLVGCTDPEATNYDPAAAVDSGACTYELQWVGAWAPEGVPVLVTPADGSSAFVAAELWCGFRADHPAAATRPLQQVAQLRATVGPDGQARFELAPYLRGQMGSLLNGSRRLDANSATAETDDLYCFYRLTVDEVSVASGYVLNSALPASRLAQYQANTWPLSAFGAVVPRWPGIDYSVSVLRQDSLQRNARVEIVAAEAAEDYGWQTISLPCPRNPLPVRWLTPAGGYGYWIFQGRHLHGDEVGEGRSYLEGGTGELRYSSREPSRRTVQVWSGPLSSLALAEGLRTLRRAVQAWYQPEPGGAWVPVLVKSPATAYRAGRPKYDFTLTLVEGVEQPVQGQ